jgi:hypothetical protein
MRKLICLVGIVVLWGGAPRPAEAVSAGKLLAKIRQVDGPGSGLDADTVRGLTPDDIAGSVGAAIGQFLDSAYSTVNTTSVSDGFCNTVDVTCNGTDFLLNCGGAVDLTAGYLTEVTELIDARVCRAGGCGFGGPTAVAVTATCLVR